MELANAVTELDAYCRQQFDQNSTLPLSQLPLADELHVATWRRYAEEAAQSTVFDILRPKLVQLHFPIQAGISETEGYRAVTRRGVSSTLIAEATGIALAAPERLELVLYDGAAGTIPVLIAPERADFVTLAQAFLWRNEPRPVPDSMGACMIAGFNNWDRVHTYQLEWRRRNPDAEWRQEFRRLIASKPLYQDRFILLSDGPYSAAPAESLQLHPSQWQRLSRQIRLEHEYAHYFTARIFGAMRRHLLDELLADYAGIVAAVGCYRADWFLHFMGLEKYPDYRPGGRFENYVNNSLADAAGTAHLQGVIVRAAETLEAFDRSCVARAAGHSDRKEQAVALYTIALHSLADLASAGGSRRLAEQYQILRHHLPTSFSTC
jgi:hypothetical protein